MPVLDQIDRRLLDLLQEGFPMTVRPYQSLGESLGLDEDEVLERIARLKHDGVIRRIGGIFDSRNMGYYSLLCASRVGEEQLDAIGQAVTGLAGVTHNYIREHEYNLWFTLTAVSPAAAEEQLAGLEKAFGIDILRLPATKIFKTRVAFKMEADNEAGLQ